jgi:predicted GTPase
MKDINKKELKAFIKSRAYEDLRKLQRKQVIAVQILSSIILLLLGATGVKIIKPIYYSAEYNYNIDVLLDLLIDNIPKEKRILKV